MSRNMLLTVRKAEIVPIGIGVTPTEHRKRVYRRQINRDFTMKTRINWLFPMLVYSVRHGK